jgi:hypothetical protein
LEEIMAVVDVRITMVNGQFVTSPDSVTLSKGRGDTIKWFNDTVERIQVRFADGSPFPAERNPYDITAGKHVDSGSIHVAENTSWSYVIIAASGAMADPQVIIER